HRRPGGDRGRPAGRHARSALRRHRVERTTVLAGGYGRHGAGRARRAERRDPDPGRGGGGRVRCGAVPRRRRSGGAARGFGDRPVPAESPPPGDPGRQQGRPAAQRHTAPRVLRARPGRSVPRVRRGRQELGGPAGPRRGGSQHPGLASGPRERADVCVLVVDAKDGMHTQDLKIANDAWERGAAIIVAVNKWDLIEEKETNTAARGQRELEERAPFLRFIPFLYLSAKTGQRV